MVIGIGLWMWLVWFGGVVIVHPTFAETLEATGFMQQ